MNLRVKVAYPFTIGMMICCGMAFPLFVAWSAGKASVKEQVKVEVVETPVPTTGFDVEIHTAYADDWSGTKNFRRIRIPEGWIVSWYSGMTNSSAAVIVSDIDHSWQPTTRVRSE